ncbi:MAG TPA: DUF998 domain-containing protein [Dehalococcoidia bacterium]|nr:DUF998 domain-containing protein [Dehalococcoidia bacterium]
MARKVLLACGPLSSALYLAAIDVVARRQHPEYHRFGSQMVSELFAVGSPTRRTQLWLGAIYNALVFGFAAGIWRSARGRRSIRLAAAALAGYGAASTAGGFWGPMDVRGTPNSRRDQRHILVTLAMSGFILATMLLGAMAGGRRFRMYSLATAMAVTLFGGLAGYLARPMPGPTPGVGLAERVNIYASMAWFAALAAALWRAPLRDGEASRQAR